MSEQLSIIIPAAGMGRRMKSYGPKSLIDINERYNLIGWQLRVLKKQYPDAETIVVVGYEADAMMKNLNPDIKPIENENYETTNVVRSIGMGLRVASHPKVLVVYGDLVFNAPAINIVGQKSRLVVDTKKRFGEDEVGVTVVDGRVTQMSYDLPNKWCQIIYLTGRELELFKKFSWDRNNSRWFGFEAINSIVSSGGIIRASEPKFMKVVEIDSSKDIEKAKQLARV